MAPSGDADEVTKLTAEAGSGAPLAVAASREDLNPDPMLEAQEEEEDQEEEQEDEFGTEDQKMTPSSY